MAMPFNFLRKYLYIYTRDANLAYILREGKLGQILRPNKKVAKYGISGSPAFALGDYTVINA